MTDIAMAARGLGRRFGRRGRRALDGCEFVLPAGRVCALVGPNGAGKSTLLSLAAGLLRPSEGHVTVLGTTPAGARERLAYVAQDKPLHPHLTVAATLRLGRELNPGRWDESVARRIVTDADLDMDAKIRALSGGQRTQVALALALAKRPELLLLDEPMADLDPLARHRITGLLMADAAEHGTTIVMSSHVVAELEGSCDHLLLLGAGRVRLAGPLDDLLAAHRLVTGSAQDSLDPHTVVESRTTGRQLTALIRPAGPVAASWQSAEPTLEELVLGHLRGPDAPALSLAESGEAAA
ncbi:ABC transporter ATP-binding protein [Streptomyces sp. NBRC 14336]|uniref:ABC transporter ATP-binding protein n=1 Tax=Streptomyces sp. NBRC 14336 TaxID=3030992 RepID=UPI0024A41B09|nr:ABC transporter ATP-binding protein [Streptomyces sp. NBRC 14336]GLW49835.1 ABC transporter ATP-binding protein [Streptomyces sp. NBRC 14336]